MEICLLCGMVNTATLWLEARIEAGICWFVRVKCRLSQIHAMMARPQLCVVLRQMQDGVCQACPLQLDRYRLWSYQLP